MLSGENTDEHDVMVIVMFGVCVSAQEVYIFATHMNSEVDRLHQQL